MNPERGREAMKVIDIVGEQVGPFEAPPLPDRLVDVNRALARQRARAVVGAPIRGLGLDAPANVSRDAAANISHSRTHRSISPAQRADAQ
jgi:hypothetical protein